MRKSSLGKGLSALFNEEVITISNISDKVHTVSINDIQAGDYQPRKNFENDKIQELADSIISNGLLQPIIVSKDSEDKKYKIIAGERRWRACRLANFNEISVIIKDISKEKALEIGLIENIQREELSAIEESAGYLRLINEFNYSIEKLCEMLGKSRSHISNMLRLNQLPDSIKEMVNNKKLSMGHARCLIGHEQAQIIAEYIVEHDLSVRQTENIVKEWKKGEYNHSILTKSNKKWLNNDSPDDLLLAKSLSEKFKVKITIEKHHVGGKLIFHFVELEELDSILQRIS